MSIKRKAEAKWSGNGKSGKGHLSLESKVLENTPYSFSTRFEDEKGTNPEELIGAAHAGCFSMKLAFVLQENDLVADEIHTESTVHLNEGKINQVELNLRAKIDGVSEDKFQSMANEAKDNCPISKLFKSDIVLNARLE